MDFPNGHIQIFSSHPPKKLQDIFWVYLIIHLCGVVELGLPQENPYLNLGITF